MFSSTSVLSGRLWGLAFIALLVAAAPVANAQSGERLNTLASKDVLVTAATETIQMAESKGSVRAVRLFNKGRDIVLSRVRIEYNDKSFHEENRVIKLNRGDRTRELDRRSGDKFVDRVVLTITPSSGGSGSAAIQVLGAQTAQGVAAIRPPTGSLSAAPTTPGQAISDHILGSQTIELWRTDRDVINVGAKYGKFDKIRLKVLETDVDLTELKAVYTTGETEVLAYNANLQKNTKSRELRLKGDRFIKEIHLAYKNKPSFRKKATIEVWGEYASAGYGPGDPGGWIHLGSDTAHWGIDRRDVVPVGRNQGKFAKLRLEPSMTITLFGLEVIYDNGEVEKLPLTSNRIRVDAGTTFGPVDLKGRRAIKEIRPSYRTRLLQPGGLRRAVVEFWGLQ